MTERPHSPVDAFYRAVISATSAQSEGSPPTSVREAAAMLWRGRDRNLEVFLARPAAGFGGGAGTWQFPGWTVGDQDQVTGISPISSIIDGLARDFGGAPETSLDAWRHVGRWVCNETYPQRVERSSWLCDARSISLAPATDTYMDCAWITPADALDEWRAGRWLLASDTLRMLRALHDCEPEAEVIAQRVAQTADEREDIWYPVAGIGVVPVRTPTLPPAITTNTYVIVGERVVVIDPATPFEGEQDRIVTALATLRDAGHVIHQVWLTHHHGDHVGAAARVAEEFGVPIAAHPETAIRLEGVVDVTVSLLHGHEAELGGDVPRTLRAIHTPGHAPGHLCFVETETGCAAVGDMVAGIGTILIDPSEGDMGLYLESLRALEAMSLSALMPAHGGIITATTDKLRAYTAHRLWREQRVVDAVEQLGSATPAELTPVAYSDTNPLAYPLAERSLVSHLHKLLAEGRVCERGGRWSPC